MDSQFPAIYICLDPVKKKIKIGFQTLEKSLTINVRCIFNDAVFIWRYSSQFAGISSFVCFCYHSIPFHLIWLCRKFHWIFNAFGNFVAMFFVAYCRIFLPIKKTKEIKQFNSSANFCCCSYQMTAKEPGKNGKRFWYFVVIWLLICKKENEKWEKKRKIEESKRQTNQERRGAHRTNRDRMHINIDPMIVSIVSSVLSFQNNEKNNILKFEIN